MALVSRPPEQHRSEGSLAAGQTRMSGWPSLWLLSLGQTRESDSPCKAKPIGGAEESVAGDTERRAGRSENKSVPFFALGTRHLGAAVAGHVGSSLSVLLAGGPYWWISKALSPLRHLNRPHRPRFDVAGA